MNHLDFKILSRFYLKKKVTQGFTLVELMIAMVISSLVIAACYQLYISQQQVMMRETFKTVGQYSLRTTVDLITRHIQAAGYSARPDIISKPIELFVNPSIQLGMYADMNQDGDMTDLGEYTEFYYDFALQEVQTKHSISGAYSVMMNNVTSFAFEYFDDLFLNLPANKITNPLLDYDRIQRIRILITAKLRDPTIDSSKWKSRSIQKDVVPSNIY